MKNILKYSAFAALALTLAACEEFVDNTQTVGGNSKLVYVNAGSDNFFTAKVIHRASGSTGTFSTEFAVHSNSPVHGAAEVTLTYDASLVESYNTRNETSYAVLPEEYLVLENATLALPENVARTEDMTKVSLSGEADLSLLTERRYLAPLRLVAEGLHVSEDMGVVYVAVETEVNVLRAVASSDEIPGFPAPGRKTWSADCSDALNLFDDNAATRVSLSASAAVIVDMKEERLFSGVSLGYSSRVPEVSVEYSLDGKTYRQAGTPGTDEYVSEGGRMNIAFQEQLEARFLRFTFASATTLSEVDIFMTDGNAPAVYAIDGTENPLTGTVTHKRSTGSSTGSADASFKVYATEVSDEGYSVSVKVDNSFVRNYNAVNGTSYAELPAANVSLTNDALSIAAGARVSDNEVGIALAGDLSSLTDANGYLAALEVSARGAETSESRGVVYLAVMPGTDVIRPISSVDEMTGLPAMGRSAWTANCDNAASLFDGNTSTQVTFPQTGNDVVVDMKSVRKMTGVSLVSATLSTVSFEYSRDGETFETLGTPAAGESVNSGSNRYYAFYDYVEARYLRLKFGFSSSSSRNRYLSEIDVYDFESERPLIYADCGTDNVLNGGSVVFAAGQTFNAVNAAFNLQASAASESGYTVAVAADNSLAEEFNKEMGTSYGTVDLSLVKIGNGVCTIPAGARISEEQVRVSLDGDLSSLNSQEGYVIPLRFFSSDALVSADRGTVYVIVGYSTDNVRKNFSPADIDGTPVADRSAWQIVKCDDGGVHSGAYIDLFDGDQSTFVRTWGGPVDFTVDMGREYDMTGFVITAVSTYPQYQPNSILIECSLDGEEYEEFRTVSTADGNLVAQVPSSYMALYGSKKVRYMHIVSSYGSNMGVGEFNIYAK